jgi:hypothetical protein
MLAHTFLGPVFAKGDNLWTGNEVGSLPRCGSVDCFEQCINGLAGPLGVHEGLIVAGQSQLSGVCMR